MPMTGEEANARRTGVEGLADMPRKSLAAVSGNRFNGHCLKSHLHDWMTAPIRDVDALVILYIDRLSMSWLR